MDAALAKKMLPGEEDATMDLLKSKVQEQLESEELSKLYNDELSIILIQITYARQALVR